MSLVMVRAIAADVNGIMADARTADEFLSNGTISEVMCKTM